MPYSPQFMVLSTIVTILIILTSIGVLLYSEKHPRPAEANAAIIVNKSKKTAKIV